MSTIKNDAINIFDFDGTLTTDTWSKCWAWISKFGYFGGQRNDHFEKSLEEYRKINTGDPYDTFIGFLNSILAINNGTITFEELMSGEKYIEYCEGVVDYLSKSSARNYIITFGLKTFLENIAIAKYITQVYGTPVIYDEDGLIKRLGEPLSEDKKILSIEDILINNNRDSCNDIFYIGDGATDIPAMKFVHNNGGKSVFVYHEDQESKDDYYSQKNLEMMSSLNSLGVIDYCCLADYREGSELRRILKRK